MAGCYCEQTSQDFQNTVLVSLSIQESMKGRLKDAMPNIPIQEVKEQRENQVMESNDRPEQMEENNEEEPNDEQEYNENSHAGTNADIDVRHNSDNGATFQHKAMNNVSAIRNRISQFKRLKHMFKRPRFGVKVFNLEDRVSDVTIDEEHDIRYGDDVNSESDSEGDYQDWIPLVRPKYNVL